MLTAARRPNHLRLFLLLLPALYGVEWIVAHGAVATREPNVAALAVTLDLTLFVPLLYWLLVVRPAGAPVARVVAVFALSLIGARLVLRPDQREYLGFTRYLVLPAELGVTLWVVSRVRRFTRERAHVARELDVYERIRAALLHSMPYAATAEVFATELSLFWYALLSWRRPAHVSPGATAFFYHRKSGVTGVFAAITLATVVETFAVHALVRHWSVSAAWTLTALSVLATIWLIGLLRSIQLRPVLLRSDTLVVRCGLRWSVDIPLRAIGSIAIGHLRPIARTDATTLKATVATQPNVLLTLDRPVRAHGLYGRSREVTRVAFTVDERAAFEHELAQRRATQPEPR